VPFFRYWFRAVREGFRDPAARPLFLTVAALLATGTVVYTAVERWSLLDSLYFSVMTLTTVGYGDFAPHTVAGKVFTMVYVLAGIAVILAFAEHVLRRMVEIRARDHPTDVPATPSPTPARGQIHD
jgi:voltage-gated potassium channel